jgi:hypothetical protein
MKNLIHKNNQCISDSVEQSVGEDYLNLFAGTPFAKTNVSTSICESNFDMALADLGTQIHESVLRTYGVPMTVGLEVIKSVSLLSGTQSRQLSPQEHSVMGDRITLSPQLPIKMGDILRVEIAHVATAN